MRKILAAAGTITVSLASVIVLALPANASGPYKICTHSGNNYCLGDDSSINIGDKVVQEVQSEARDIQWNFIDKNCSGSGTDCFRVYLSFSANNYRIGVSSDCNGSVYVRSATDGTGTVWWDHTQSDGTDIFESQHCPGFVLETNNMDEDPWRNGSEAAGFYYRLDLKFVG